MKTIKPEEVYVAATRPSMRSRHACRYSSERAYNAKRMYPALGYRTPEEFEIPLAQQAA